MTGKHRFLCVSLLCGIRLLAAAARADEPPPTTQDAALPDHRIPILEQRILDARRAIKTGEFEIQWDTRGGSHGLDSVAYHIWLGEKGRLREERDADFQPQTIVLDDQFAYYFEQKAHAELSPYLNRRPWVLRERIADMKQSELPYLVHNPLKIMMVPSNFQLAPHHELDQLLTAPGREKFQRRDSTWKGEPSVIVAFFMPKTGNTFEYEAVPSHSFNIVRWTISGRRGKTLAAEAFDDTYTCELKEVADSIWFPQKVESLQHVNGAPRETQTLTIKATLINQPSDDKVFTLAGDTVPPNVLVNSTNHFRANRAVPLNPGPLLIWDGKAVRLLNPDEQKQLQSGTQP